MIEINNLKKGEFLLNNYISSCIFTCEKGIYSSIFSPRTIMNKPKIWVEETLALQFNNRGGTM